MRILFLSNHYPPHDRGGYERWCHEVAEELSTRGHRVVVLTSRQATRSSEAEDGRVEVLRRLYLEADPGFWKTAFRFFFLRKSFACRNMTYVRDAVEHYQPEIGLVWGMWNVPRVVPALAEELLGDCVAYYMCDYWCSLPSGYAHYWQTASGRPLTRLPKRWLGRWALKRVEQGLPPLSLRHPIFVSQAVQDQIASAGVTTGNGTVIHGGIAVERFAEAALGSRTPGDPKLRGLYAGRLAPEKGVHTAIRAIDLLADSHRSRLTLHVAGSGSRDYECHLKDLVGKLGLQDQVTFLGRVPHQQIPQVFAAHDVLLFPSEWPEPFSRVVLEAMASGLAVVASTAGGTCEVVSEGQTGLTFPPGDADALAGQLQRLVEDPQLRKRLASQGQTCVKERFTLQHMVDGIERQLERVVRESKTRCSAYPVPV